MSSNEGKPEDSKHSPKPPPGRPANVQSSEALQIKSHGSARSLRSASAGDVGDADSQDDSSDYARRMSMSSMTNEGLDDSALI